MATLIRETFKTSRLAEFCSTKELVNQTGHEVADWPLVILKELLDNALDGCEEAGIAPEVSVTIDADGITVADNGGGISAETVADVTDYTKRVSSREAYVSPTRGAQGNALKTILASPSPWTVSAAPSPLRAVASRTPSTSRLTASARNRASS